jgi:hypothetical protein
LAISRAIRIASGRRDAATLPGAVGGAEIDPDISSP